MFPLSPSDCPPSSGFWFPAGCRLVYTTLHTGNQKKLAHREDHPDGKNAETSLAARSLCCCLGDIWWLVKRDLKCTPCPYTLDQSIGRYSVRVEHTQRISKMCKDQTIFSGKAPKRITRKNLPNEKYSGERTESRSILNLTVPQHQWIAMHSRIRAFSKSLPWHSLTTQTSHSSCIQF